MGRFDKPLILAVLDTGNLPQWYCDCARNVARTDVVLVAQDSRFSSRYPDGHLKPLTELSSVVELTRDAVRAVPATLGKAGCIGNVACKFVQVLWMYFQTSQIIC